jgi:hypothetical protein
MICAILCSAESWADVAEWGEDNETWLKKYLGLAHGTASHDTFSRVFRLLDAKVFEACFREWVMSPVGVIKEVVAIDGKTVRGSQDGPNTALHRISACATTSGLCLAQEGARGERQGNRGHRSTSGNPDAQGMHRHDGCAWMSDGNRPEDTG